MAVSQVAYSGKKEVMVKIVKGGHLFVHSHYTFSLNQENFAESKALILSGMLMNDAASLANP